MQEKKLVRESSGYTVYQISKTVPVADFLADCVDVPRFEALCRSCPNYGRRWSCPPFAFDPMSIWQKYSALDLFVHILEPKAGQTASGMLAAHQEEKGRMVETLTALEEKMDGSMALWAGTCDLCPECAKAEGKPCRFPERMRHSIEALGGDVGKTAEKYFGLPILWVQADQVPDYMTLVGGILHNE